MKKIAMILSICCLFSILGFYNVVFADQDVQVIVNDHPIAFAEGSEPFIMQDRTMIPLRSVSEALDATVYWFDDDKRIQIVLYDTLLSIKIGRDQISVYKIEEGKAVHKKNIILDANAVIHNDRSYVPIRAIAEAFQADVSWNNDIRAAVIKTKEIQKNFMDVPQLLRADPGTLFATYAVITYSEEKNAFALRTLQDDGLGYYTEIQFCTPLETSISDNTEYAEYAKRYWTEILGTENPAGTVIEFSGIISRVDGTNYAVLNKTTTAVKNLGFYDDYMEAQNLYFEPFSNDYKVDDRTFVNGSVMPAN